MIKHVPVHVCIKHFNDRVKLLQGLSTRCLSGDSVPIYLFPILLKFGTHGQPILNAIYIRSVQFLLLHSHIPCDQGNNEIRDEKKE